MLTATAASVVASSGRRTNAIPSLLGSNVTDGATRFAPFASVHAW